MKLLMTYFFIVFFLGVCCLVPLRFKFQYCKEGKDDYLSLTWQLVPNLWGITWEIPFLKLSSSSLWPLIKFAIGLGGERGKPITPKEIDFLLDKDQLRKFLKIIFSLYKKRKTIAKLINWVLSKTILQEFHWSTKLGTKEADKTGILVGIIWTIKINLYSYLRTHIKNTENSPKIMVQANFQHRELNCQLFCIFRISFGYIIIGAIKSVSMLFFMKKAVIRYERSSHRGINENSYGKY